MSSRPLLKPFPSISNGDMSASLVGIPSIIQSLPAISYGFTWTGTPTGTFSVEVSNDYSLNPDGKTVANAGTWSALPLSAAAVAQGSADHGAVDVHNTGFYAIRPRYTFSSGSGTLNVTLCGKVL